jgi:hypothetical protein
MEFKANIKPEDVIKGYIWLETAPSKNSLIKLSNNDIKSRTPYYQYIEEINWSNRFGCYIMKLNPEGQAKWEQERKEMMEFFSRYGTV